jgi:hypothetical protein
VVVGTPVTQKERTRDLSSLLILELTRFASDLVSSFRRILCTSENRLLTLLASGLVDDKVEYARDGAIKLVAGRAGTIAFN